MQLAVEVIFGLAVGAVAGAAITGIRLFLTIRHLNRYERNHPPNRRS